VSRRQIPKNNKVSNAWIITEEDPTGDYELTVSINKDVSRVLWKLPPGVTAGILGAVRR
jgi:hypothetical protein